MALNEEILISHTEWTQNALDLLLGVIAASLKVRRLLQLQCTEEDQTVEPRAWGTAAHVRQSLNVRKDCNNSVNH